MGLQIDNGSYQANGPLASVPGLETTGRSAPRDRHVLRSAMFILAMGIVGGALIYAAGGKNMPTDHARESARQVGISSDVAGLVSEVDVVNNQHVTRGQVLFRLDPRLFQIVLDNAETTLLQTAVKLATDKISYDQIMGDIAIEETLVQVDHATLDQYALLSDGGEINKQQYDQAEHELDGDVARLSALRQQAQATSAETDGKPDTPVTAFPQYLQAKEEVRKAQRELDETVVKAPFSGTVTDVPSLMQGKYLAPYATAFHLIDTDHVWVNANPRAISSTRISLGQQAMIATHAYLAQAAQPVPERVRVTTHNLMLPPLDPG